MVSNKSGYLICPMCDADVPVDGDEKPGTEVYCPYCQTPLLVQVNKDDESFFEEDY